LGIEPTLNVTRGENANHYTIDARPGAISWSIPYNDNSDNKEGTLMQLLWPTCVLLPLFRYPLVDY